MYRCRGYNGVFPKPCVPLQMPYSEQDEDKLEGDEGQVPKEAGLGLAAERQVKHGLCHCTQFIYIFIKTYSNMFIKQGESSQQWPLGLWQ